MSSSTAVPLSRHLRRKTRNIRSRKSTLVMWMRNRSGRAQSDSLRAAFHHSPLSKLGYLLARGALKKLAARIDPRRYNGAMFLGLGGIAVKSHGSTDAFGFANAIGVAVDMQVNGLLEKIRNEIVRLNQEAPVPQSAAL